ncbi:hypothetical protein [Chryseobacterium piperi]|uniref:hypothetical protein n=1 Tax=Chryseobacterium piperi TaxID=558152 RepID=UPI000AB03E2C|nr:hypothetical protein [Chryseobacterium piperi]
MKRKRKIIWYLNITGSTLLLGYIIYKVSTSIKDDNEPFPLFLISLWILLTIQCFRNWENDI